MDLLLLLLLLLNLFCSVFLLTEASNSNHNCTQSSKCNPLSPEIHFPFRINGLDHPHDHCATHHPQFDLFCTKNRTMIRFPNYGDLIVNSISYDERKLSLVDPKNCVHEVFLNLNLSLTPFSYYYTLKEYKYINCSDELVGAFEQVPCLSGSRYHVYVVESSFSLPVNSCSCLKTVAIPFSYSPYLTDNSFGLGLTWDSTDHEVVREIGSLEIYFKVSGIIMAFVLMVGLILYEYRQELNEVMKIR